MVKDYHMHPVVVKDREKFDLFAKKAIEEGIEEICVTDHMPLSVSNAGDRIPQGRVEEYCRMVRELAAEYEGKLSVKLGIEMDYDPEYLDEIEAVLKAGSFDFVIGSSHLHVGDKYIERGFVTRNRFAEASLINTIEAAKSGYFDAIAHLDSYRWVFTLPERFPIEDDGYSFEKHLPLVAEALDTIKKQGLFLEVNTHLAAIEQNTESTYPERGITQMALERNLKFSYGSDAHAPDRVGAYLRQLKAHPVYSQAMKQWEEMK